LFILCTAMMNNIKSKRESVNICPTMLRISQIMLQMLRIK
jgi:hypothetical protein